ncbi:glycosyl hydrolase [Streptodolium elevatio]|uniref:Glycosyl hydrolase n=1 Tax=Streptodolium elevatio TaxID=3157996 RepID=A0ABV3DEK0_9ACTN
MTHAPVGDPGPLPGRIAAILADPPRAFSPTAIWWWSGEALDPARLRDQLERFAEGGVFNLVLLNLAPSGPLFGADADDPPFLSEAWWLLLQGVCDDARELGIGLWFYDQLGFSGADLQARLVDENPRYGGRRLERLRAVVDGADVPGELRCPEPGRPIAAQAEPVDGDDRPTGPPVALVPDGQVVRAPGPGRWRLTLHHHTPLGFDYLGTEACATLLDQVHGAFERRLGDRLGSVVVGSFQDELPALPTWSDGFAEAFRSLRGYDLTARLDALYHDSSRPDAEQVRRDYHRTRAELAESAFFRPLAEWHEKHGLLVGCDQQDPARAGHPVGGVELYADYARTHRWFSAPGSDHHGDARIHSSLAHLYGRPRTWIEAFHSTGWGGTLEETFDWLLPWLRAGATLYNPHAVYYTTKGGWWEWAPPGTDWRQPYWRHHRVFADAVTRLCAVLSLDRHLCDVAVLLPTTTVQAGAALDGVGADARRAQETYLELVGDMTWFRTAPGVLDRLGVDADVIDDASVAASRVHDDGSHARMRVADEAYTVIVLPSCTVLEQDTARRLVEFAAAGGTVVAVGALPRRVVGPDATEALDALLALFADGRAVFVPASADLDDVLAVRERVVRASVPVLARRVDGATVLFLTAGSPRATHAAVAAPDERGAALGWLDARYDFDPARYASHARARVRGVEGPAVLLDPFGGTPRVLPVHPASDDPHAVDVEVPFDAGPAAIVVFPGDASPTDPGASPLPAAVPVSTPASAPLVEIPADAAWDMELVPTLDDTWGDFSRPATGPPPVGTAFVETRAFRHRVEQSVDAEGERSDHPEDDREDGGAPATTDAPGEVHATFGPRAVLVDAEGSVRSEVAWSDTRGIHKDPVHRDVLGPKGHVPEEFLRLGPATDGSVVRVRTELLLDAPFDGHLAIGAAAVKSVRLDGLPVALDDRGHLAFGPVELTPGRRLLELDLTAEHDGELRAHVALVRDIERYRRPEWILAPGPGGGAVLGTTVSLAAVPARAVVQVAARGSCVLRVNGEPVGRQGGFDPYADHAIPRVRRHDVTEALRVGDNDITVEVAADGDPAVLVDAVLGETAVHSDAAWWSERGGVREPAVVRREAVGDPAALYLRRRPHPLPGAAWLDPDADDGTVLPVDFAVPGRGAAVEWFEWRLSPGALRLTARVHGDTAVFVDGRERTAVTSGTDDGVRTVEVDLSDDGPAGARTAALRVRTGPGRRGGAALADAVRCEVGRGPILLGDWEERGLAEYSGGVRYGRMLPPVAATGRVLLDLGRVRGTAEVSVAGVSAGVRVCSPYVFDVTGLVGDAPVRAEVTVYGTLAPHLDATSPTHFVFPGQRVTGLMGPVRVLGVA